MGTKRPLPKADGGEPAPIPKRFRGTAKGSEEAPFTSIVPLSLGKSKTTIKPQGAALHIYKTPEAPLVSDGSVASNEITPSRPDEELISSLREYIDGHPALDAVYKTSVSPLIAPAALPNEDDQDAQPEDDGDKVISGTNFHTNLDLDRPPMSDQDAVFDDMAENLTTTGFYQAIELLKNRQLRVFTMCSGTEAPIIAMRKLKAAFERKGFKGFNVYHVGSAEIEPFKQAYIQTNFAPPLIFRDVTDFHDENMKEQDPLTVYGASATPPENVDILVAGSACVDYSNLNVSPKSFKEEGESWTTMKGIAHYAKRYRPVIVILENVVGAPWKEIIAYWETLQYVCHVVKVDSKNFYLPQTRQRGYMLAIDKKLADEEMFNYEENFVRFEANLKSLARRATSPYTDFTYFPDDPKFEIMMQDIMSATTSRKGGSNWETCLLRYNQHRSLLKLGFSRAVTFWQNNGTSRLPDYFAMRAFMQKKCERILDTLDIVMPRSVVQRHYDIFYKNRVLDVSQNVDRERDTRHFGIIPCITPDGQLFDTLRGGILTGKELLSLQGMPVDELTFNTETSKQLTDLAGNAMTVPVIGAFMTAALSVTVFKKQGETDSKSLFPTVGRNNLDVQQASLTHIPHEQVIQTWEAKQLHLAKLDLGRKGDATFEVIKASASQSRQLCLCEGYLGLRTNAQFSICKGCGHTVCAICKGNPEHEYRDLPIKERLSPSKFISFIQQNLPRSMTLDCKASDIPLASLHPFDDENANQDYQELVSTAVASTYHYSKIKRGRGWKVEYVAPAGRLELRIFPSFQASDLSSHDPLDGEAVNCQWLLFASCGEGESAASLLRKLLQNPVARMHPCGEILRGQWQIWDPRPLLVNMTISGGGEMRESLESRMGIKDPLWKGRNEFSTIEIHGFGPLQTQVVEFRLLPNCAAPHGSIYRSVKPYEQQVLYFLLNADPFRPADQDAYVVTTDPHRRNNHDHRQVMFSFPCGWRMNIESGCIRDDSHACQYVDGWFELEPMSVSSDHGFARIWLSTRDPVTAESLALCRGIEQPAFGIEIPVSKQSHRAFPPQTVFEIDLATQSGQLHHLEWLLTQVANTSRRSNQWQFLGHWDAAEQQCECVASPPGLTWYWVWFNGRCNKKVIKPFEDPAAASKFEEELKHRPSPATAIVRCYEASVFIEVQFNPQTLAHRSALAFQASAERGEVRTEWRVAGYNPLDKLPTFEPIALLSNKHDVCRSIELSMFVRKLLPGQERLLTWACNQELGLSTDWEEVHQSDLPIAPLNVSLEARAMRSHAVRGGVFADDVGAGKTTSALALIATDTLEPQAQSPPPIQSSRMHSEATLILVPKDIMTQWKDQINECFRKGSIQVVQIETPNDLIKLKVEDLVGEKIILAAWDLFDDVKYWECLRVLSYSPNVPFSGGRAFEQWMDLALDNLEKMFQNYNEVDNGHFWSQRETGKARLDQFHPFPAYRSKQANKKSYAANKLPEGPAKNAMEKSRKFKPKPFEATSADDKLDAAYEQQMEVWPRAVGSKADKKIRKIYALFHAFNFRRLIIDEFQYLRDLSLHGVIALSARTRWLLSATPPINSLQGINVMARLLGTFITRDEVRPEHLGADFKSCASVQSRSHVEDFLRHLTTPSLSGMKAEYTHANRFLNNFVRHNELVLINSQRRDNYVVFKPSALEYATFLEFFQVVLSNSVTFCKQNPPDATFTTRSERISKWVQYSKNALHALMCCTSYMRNDNGAADCMAILEAQKVTFGDFGTKLLQNFRETFWFDGQLLSDAMRNSGMTEENEHWRKFVHSIAAGDYEDPVVTDFVNRLLRLASNTLKKPNDLAINDRENQLRKSRTKPNDQDIILEKDWQEKTTRNKEMSWRNKLMTGQVLRLIKTARAVRFFDTVSKITSGSDEAKCGRCHVAKHEELADLFLLATCGHSVCRSCLDVQAKVRDDQCPLDGCKIFLNGRLQMSGTVFGTDEIIPHSKYGSRMDKVIETINNVLTKPDKSKVLIFVQFDQMKEHLTDALGAAEITFTDGTKNAGKEVEAFKTNQDSRVLLLKIDTADAAGWNLHMINHVMFVAPLLMSTKHAYDSIMRQAVGRALRFRNNSPVVEVYHFAMARTCEVNILEERTGKVLVRREGEVKLVDKALDGDVLLRGPSLDNHEIAGTEGDDDDSGEGAEEGECGESTA